MATVSPRSIVNEVFERDPRAAVEELELLAELAHDGRRGASRDLDGYCLLHFAHQMLLRRTA